MPLAHFQTGCIKYCGKYYIHCTVEVRPMLRRGSSFRAVFMQWLGITGASDTPVPSGHTLSSCLSFVLLSRQRNGYLRSVNELA